MTEGPLKAPAIGITLSSGLFEDDFSLNTLFNPKAFKSYPRSRLFFITIKDNSNNSQSKWKSIGKINDWIRKYSTTYLIVKGTNGGPHFHLLAGTKLSEPNFRCQKGIHFHIKNLSLTKPSSYSFEDAFESFQSKKFSESIQDSIADRHQRALTQDQRHCLLLICYAIRDRFHKQKRRIRDKAARVLSLDKKTKSIISVLDYLHQNLLEPRSHSPYVYEDYISKV